MGNASYFQIYYIMYFIYCYMYIRTIYFWKHKFTQLRARIDVRQQPRPLQRAPSAPAVDPSTLDTLPMFHDFLEGNTPTKPDEDAETRDKSHGLADLPPAEINSDLPGDAMEPKTRDQLGSDLPDQPCRTLDQPVASDDKSVHDEAEPPAPQNVVTEKAEGEHGGAVPLEDTKEGGEKDDPHEGKPDAADGSEDLFNVEVQTTRQEQFEERDRLAKEAPLTKKQAKAAAAKKKKADDKEKAKLAKENSKALAKAKAKFQKERAKAEKLAEKLAAKGEKKERLHRRRRQQRFEKVRARRHMMRAQQRPLRLMMEMLRAQRSRNPRSPAPRRPSYITLLVMALPPSLRQAALPLPKLLMIVMPPQTHHRSAKLRICPKAPMIPRRAPRRRQLLPGESVARLRRQQSAGTASRECSWSLWPQ